MEKSAPPPKPIKTDNDIAQEVVDAGRIIHAGVRTGDRTTQGVGTSRVIKQIGTDISPELAKFLGLDKVETSDD